jgi:hypothetical protein
MSKNIFVGKSFLARYSRTTYEFFKSKEWFSLIDIQRVQLQRMKAELDASISCSGHYSILKRANHEVRKAIHEKMGKDSNCIEEKGNNRNKLFRYVGHDPDPLREMLQATKEMDLKDYYKFCLDSAGLLPIEWLEHFFHDYQELLDIKNMKRKGEETISVSIDRQQDNIHLFPLLYEAISKKNVLKIRYKPFEEEEDLLEFHPHYLKEYNGRWFLLGHREGKEPEFGYIIALDRIQGNPLVLKDVEYIKAPRFFYRNYFEDIVGVSHSEGAKTETVVIRAYGTYIYNLINTKRIHKSQQVSKPLDTYNGVEYGEFQLKVIPNKELRGRILTYGAGLEVVSPEYLRKEYTEEANKLLSRYQNESL